MHWKFDIILQLIGSFSNKFFFSPMSMSQRKKFSNQSFFELKSENVLRKLAQEKAQVWACAGRKSTKETLPFT
jgi:hypothetical protein